MNIFGPAFTPIETKKKIFFQFFKNFIIFYSFFILFIVKITLLTKRKK